MRKYSKIVLRRFLYVPRRELKRYKDVVRHLTVRSKYPEGPTVKLFDDTDRSWFGFPLYDDRYKDLADEVIDRRADGREVDFRFTARLWPGQDVIIDKFKRLVAKGKTGILLESKAGTGKTVMLIKMIQHLGRTALVVVPRANLVDQWIERLLEHTDLKKHQIGVAAGGKAVWRGKVVVVGLVHTLGLDITGGCNRFGREFCDYFGTVVFDEVDRSVPPATFAPVVTMFPAKYRIGASATFKRKDGLDVVFWSHIGEAYIAGAVKNRQEPTVLMVYYDGEYPKLWPGLGKVQAKGVILSHIAKDLRRNIVVARYAASLWKSGRRSLVLSDRTLQLALLRDLLISRFKVPPEDIGFFCGSIPVKVGGKYVKLKGKNGYKSRMVSEKECAFSASACKILLATNGKFAIGSDIPDLAGLVYATPSSETEQSKGRIERYVAGKAQPVVVDIVDTFYRQTLGWAQARLGQYKKAGLKVKTIRAGGK